MGLLLLKKNLPERELDKTKILQQQGYQKQFNNLTETAIGVDSP